MEEIIAFCNNDFLGVPIWKYGASLLAILGGFLGKKLLSTLFRRLEDLSKKTRLQADDLLIQSLSKPVEAGFMIGGIFGALFILPLPVEPVDFPRAVRALGNAFIVVFVVWIAVRLVDSFGVLWERKARASESKLDDQLVPIVRRSLKVFTYVIGGVFVLQNLGYSVTSLLAGFGIGGAALAFAAKDTMTNLFGSMVIFLDKPFQIGDWIEMGDIEGTVEDVGLRTIRVRTFANSVITVPNSKFTTNAVNNWSRMQKRRIKMYVGVKYSSSPEKLRILVDKIREIIRNDENLRDDFFLVNFDRFGPSSLDIFIYCFTKTTVWKEFLEVKEAFLLRIMEAVQDLGLEFAFPSQSLYIESLPKKNSLPE